MKDIIYRPIGVIHTPFKTSDQAPRQGVFSEKEGIIEVFPEYKEGLNDIEGFSHVIILYHLHLSTGYSLKLVPSVDDKERGVFTTRSPRRPNPIGFSIIEITRVEGNKIYARDIDMVDGTPLLDIKPYVPDLNPPEVRTGWMGDKFSQLMNNHSKNHSSQDK